MPHWICWHTFPLLSYSSGQQAPCTLTLLQSLPFSPTASGDYTEVLGFPVRFQEGSFTARVTVVINDDVIVEENEVFLARLRHVGIEAISIVEEEARVTITDNDGENITCIASL